MIQQMIGSDTATEREYVRKLVRKIRDLRESLRNEHEVERRLVLLGRIHQAEEDLATLRASL